MSATSDRQVRKGRFIAKAVKGGVACLCLAAVIYVLNVWQFDQSLQNILSVATGNPGWAIIIVIALMVAHNVMPVPAEVIAIAAGSILGLVPGFLAVWSGAMLGACFAFWMSRIWGRNLVSRFLPDACLDRLDQITAHNAWPALLGLRLIPIISFNLVNYSAGLTSVPWPTFVWTTAIGIVPIALLSVAVGANIEIMPLEYLAIGILIIASLKFAHNYRRK